MHYCLVIYQLSPHHLNAVTTRLYRVGSNCAHLKSGSSVGVGSNCNSCHERPGGSSGSLGLIFKMNSRTCRSPGPSSLSTSPGDAACLSTESPSPAACALVDIGGALLVWAFAPSLPSRLCDTPRGGGGLGDTDAVAPLARGGKELGPVST